jgi:hypothetical protein
MVPSRSQPLRAGENRAQVGHDAQQHLGGRAIFVARVPSTPIEAFALIRENSAGGGAAGWQHDLEGIAFHLVRAGTKPCKTCHLIEAGARYYERGALASLLVPGPGSKSSHTMSPGCGT